MILLGEPTTEQITTGLIRRWYQGRQIVSYELLDAARTSIDAWGQAVLHDVHAWDKARPFLAVHNLVRLGMTPYGRAVGVRVAKQFPADIQGRYANIVAKGLLGNTIKLFGTFELKRLLPQLESEFFFEEESALKWLAVKLV